MEESSTPHAAAMGMVRAQYVYKPCLWSGECVMIVGPLLQEKLAGFHPSCALYLRVSVWLPPDWAGVTGMTAASVEKLNEAAC